MAQSLIGGTQDAGLCLGRVTSWPDEHNPDRPHRLTAEGNTQERADLLADEGLLPYGLKTGDTVVLFPIEEHQRYVILCKAVKV